MANDKWAAQMDRRVEQMRRDPVQYVEAAKREASRTVLVASRPSTSKGKSGRR